ncbi:MAG TPA: phenylalanine--tRNA ligase subunit beta [Candidatus Baltobacteraceae bacterium]|nr:phenylalanine--tRNA ligase subunit beta [Candidatus Baltobacteraceae bacterium]
MKVPIAWLRQYVDLPGEAQAVADLLASIGFPVDAIEKPPVLSGIVVGKITALEKHPNADRLQIGTIDIGMREPLKIATAATNVAQDQIIPVAQIGAQLPNLKIERRKMRGFESEGMMCSAEELGLPRDWFEDGILQMDSDTLLGEDVVKLFHLQDAVLDVDVTSNRPDAMSVVGLARELAAATGAELRLPVELQTTAVRVTSKDVDPDKDPGGPAVTLESKDCTRFVAQRFSGVRVGPAPLWMRVRLALAGQRPINNLVDISNYVMLEVGQPLHFYDAAKIGGNHLIARDAKPGEKLLTLDDVEHELKPSMLVIADEERALGLAGLKGGKSSEVSPATSSIVLESANFTGARIRRMSAALAFRTDASSRHEKTLAPVLTDIGAARAAALLIAEGATAYAPHAFGNDIAEPAPIAFAVRDVKRLLGFELSNSDIEKHLRALGFAVKERDAQHLDVTPPLWRRDVSIGADIVEEIARMAGYDNVPLEIPAIPDHEIPSRAYHLERDLADSLRSLGYHEIISYSLHGPQIREKLKQAGIEPGERFVEVRNPLSEDQRYLRYGLGTGLCEYFAGRTEPFKVFEIGHSFAQLDHTIEETALLGFAFTAPVLNEPAWRDTNFLRLKGDAEAMILALTGRLPEVARDTRNGLHPGKTAVLMLDGKEVAFIGEVDPRLVRAFDVRFPIYIGSAYLERLPDRTTRQFTPPSRFPSTYRDLALILDPGVAAVAVERTVASATAPLCKRVVVFDEYRGPQVGEHKKSLAVRVVLQRDDATITDQEADAAVEKALAALESELGATLRA